MSEEKYIVDRDEIKNMQGLEKSHFLNANAKRTNKSLGDLTGIDGFGFHIIEVSVGHNTTEHHLHHHEDECVFVLSGNATAYIGDESFQISEGDFIGYRKGGLAHSITNTGTETLRCIVVGERLSHDVCDYPRLEKRMYRNANLKWNVVSYGSIDEPTSAGKK